MSCDYCDTCRESHVRYCATCGQQVSPDFFPATWVAICSPCLTQENKALRLEDGPSITSQRHCTCCGKETDRLFFIEPYGDEHQAALHELSQSLEDLHQDTAQRRKDLDAAQGFDGDGALGGNLQDLD
jgi:hypothetical protein